VIVLALNAGSSSLKLALFDDERRLAKEEVPVEDHATAARAAFDGMERDGLPRPEAVGHRFVHGGPRHDRPALVDRSLREELAALVPFAPLHLPAELRVLDAARERYPDAAQVACFDTSFHRTLPDVAERFALPRELYDRGVRRYGFHGLSYEYVVRAVGADALGRAVVAHLGNGASMCAVTGGKSVDTSMGLTPAGGLMMGTRPGDLDPGVLLRLLDEGMDARSLGDLVNDRSGLLGVSGTTSDMKRLLAAAPADPRASLAVEMFSYAAKKQVGAYAAVLGGLDTLVFTGGIGERAARVRARICAGLEHLGVHLDESKNARDEREIGEGPCRVLVVPTDEESVIARHALAMLRSERRGPADEGTPSGPH
jgi:acetate kinase